MNTKENMVAFIVVFSIISFLVCIFPIYILSTSENIPLWLGILKALFVATIIFGPILLIIWALLYVMTKWQDIINKW